jgi:hypothetical protein
LGLHTRRKKVPVGDAVGVHDVEEGWDVMLISDTVKFLNSWFAERSEFLVIDTVKDNEHGMCSVECNPLWALPPLVLLNFGLHMVQVAPSPMHPCSHVRRN